MRWHVTAELVGEDGTVIWGYMHSEIVPPPDGSPDSTAEQVELRMIETGGKLLDSLDAAKESVSAQIRAEGVGRS